MLSTEKELIGKTGQIDLESLPVFIAAIHRCSTLLHFLPDEMRDEAREVVAQLFTLSDRLEDAVSGHLKESDEIIKYTDIIFLVNKKGQTEKGETGSNIIRLSETAELAHFTISELDDPVRLFIKWRKQTGVVPYSKAFFEGVIFERYGYTKLDQ